MKSELEAAIYAARQAGNLLRDNFGKAHQVEYKGVIDPVTEMDARCEKLIGQILQRAFPTYGFLSEEKLNSHIADQPRWIIDPLDGTTNYVHSFPYFGVSIALERDCDVVIAVVYNPILDELYSAQKDLGAVMNDQSIHVSPTRELGKSLVASGFPYDAWTSPADNGAEWWRFVKRVVSVRSNGAAAIDLCNVAMGRLDGHWELDLGPWDMAAGALIVQEAGGVVTSAYGEPYNPHGKSILAANEYLHPAMLEVIRSSDFVPG